MRHTLFKRALCALMIVAFVCTGIVPPSSAQSVVDLPQPGTLVPLTQAFDPLVLKGIKVHADDPFQFEFILDKGNAAASDEALKEGSSRLIRYFLAALTVPEGDLWVNLSPYEKDRIITEAFGQTEMGRDLLSQDYILKQITASLMHPEGDIGKEFWERVYAGAYDMYGTTDVPVDTFNKVWVMPDKAVVYEESGVAFIGESRLKVMLESDYLAVEKNALPTGGHDQTPSSVAQGIIRDVLLPVIEKEVNEGRNFAPLRQVYQALILAAWYKRKVKDSLLSSVYVDQKKIRGVTIEDPQESVRIWERYVEAFRKGAYNYIKEERDQYTQELIPRKYFSGGFDGAQMNTVMETRPMRALAGLGAWARRTLLIAVTLTAINVSPLLAADGERGGLLANKPEMVMVDERPAVEEDVVRSADAVVRDLFRADSITVQDAKEELGARPEEARNAIMGILKDAHAYRRSILESELAQRGVLKKYNRMLRESDRMLAPIFRKGNAVGAQNLEKWRLQRADIDLLKDIIRTNGLEDSEFFTQLTGYYAGQDLSDDFIEAIMDMRIAGSILRYLPEDVRAKVIPREQDISQKRGRRVMTIFFGLLTSIFAGVGISAMGWPKFKRMVVSLFSGDKVLGNGLQAFSGRLSWWERSRFKFLMKYALTDEDHYDVQQMFGKAANILNAYDESIFLKGWDLLYSAMRAGGRVDRITEKPWGVAHHPGNEEFFAVLFDRGWINAAHMDKIRDLVRAINERDRGWTRDPVMQNTVLLLQEENMTPEDIPRVTASLDRQRRQERDSYQYLLDDVWEPVRRKITLNSHGKEALDALERIAVLRQQAADKEGNIVGRIEANKSLMDRFGMDVSWDFVPGKLSLPAEFGPLLAQLLSDYSWNYGDRVFSSVQELWGQWQARGGSQEEFTVLLSSTGIRGIEGLARHTGIPPITALWDEWRTNGSAEELGQVLRGFQSYNRLDMLGSGVFREKLWHVWGAWKLQQQGTAEQFVKTVNALGWRQEDVPRLLPVLDGLVDLLSGWGKKRDMLNELSGILTQYSAVLSADNYKMFFSALLALHASWQDRAFPYSLSDALQRVRGIVDGTNFSGVFKQLLVLAERWDLLKGRSPEFNQAIAQISSVLTKDNYKEIFAALAQMLPLLQKLDRDIKAPLVLLLAARDDMERLVQRLDEWRSDEQRQNNLEDLTNAVFGMQGKEQNRIGMSLLQAASLAKEIILSGVPKYVYVLESIVERGPMDPGNSPLLEAVLDERGGLEDRMALASNYFEIILVREMLKGQALEPGTPAHELMQLVQKVHEAMNARLEGLSAEGTTSSQWRKTREKEDLLNELRHGFLKYITGHEVSAEQVSALSHAGLFKQIMTILGITITLKQADFQESSLGLSAVRMAFKFFFDNYKGDTKEAVAAMTRGLMAIDAQQVKGLDPSTNRTMSNKETIDKLVVAGYSPRLWTDGVDIQVNLSAVDDIFAKRKRIRQSAHEMVEIALKAGIKILSLEEADQLSSLEGARSFLDELTAKLAEQKRELSPQRQERIDMILRDIARIEEERAGTAEPQEFRVTFRKDFFSEATAGVGRNIPGCFNPKGIHREMPIVHALEANAGFLQIYQDDVQVGNAVVVLTEDGAYVYDGYAGGGYNAGLAFAQAIMELSKYVPRIYLSTSSAGADVLAGFGEKVAGTVTLTKPSTIFTDQYFDNGNTRHGGAAEIVLHDPLLLTKEMLDVQGAWVSVDKPVVVEKAFVPGTDIDFQGLADKMIKEEKGKHKKFLPLMRELKTMVAGQEKLLVDEDFYDRIFELASVKARDLKKEDVDEFSDLFLDFLEEKMFPLDVQTAHADHAMGQEAVGGIDLNAVDGALQVNASGEALRFSMDPALFEQYRSSPGFVPVIMGMEELNDLPAFLGIPVGVN